MIRAQLGSKELGYYFVAAKLSIPLQFYPGLVLNYYTSSLVKNKGVNFGQSLFRVFIIIELPAFLFILLVSSIGSELVVYLFGNDYEKAGSLLIYFGIINALIFLNAIWNRLMLILMLTKPSLYFNLSAGVINIVLSYNLIESMGSIGALISLIITLIVVQIAYYIIYREKVLGLFKEA
jgi:O-antigen/teichoic acid export membrane protein